MKTIKTIAKVTPSKFAARVPAPLEGIMSERNQRVSEPRIPPRETSQIALKS